jgi:fibronectin-binding autotransporter adhesin
MKSLIRGIAFVCLAVLLITSAAFSQTNSSWNGGTGTWNTAGSWTPSGVPNNGGGKTYNVTIDSGGTDVVTLNISPTINLLNLGGPSGGGAELADASGSPETLKITGALTLGATGTLDLSYGSTVSAASATNAGAIYLQGGSSLSVSGNLTNSNFVGTDYFCCSTNSSLTVTGTFTNNSNASFEVGANNDSADVDSVGALVNNGLLVIGTGATLKLTNQASGITDVGAGSHIELSGSIKAGSNNGLVKLASIEGELQLENGQSLTLTPTTLTLSSTAFLDIQAGSSLTVANIANSGNVSTDYYCCSTNSALTVSGTFTNNAGADLEIGANNDGGDVANIGTLLNNGYLLIGTGSTLNLTNQANGITDVAAGSSVILDGTIKAGSNNGLYKLASIEGTWQLENGQSTTDTASTLTISNTGFLDVQGTGTSSATGSSFTVANITNSGNVSTDYYCCGSNSSLTVSGTFTNNSGADLEVGSDNEGGDVANIGTLVNNGYLLIGTDSTLNLTAQPSGITSIAAGSTINLAGTLKAGSNNGLYQLATISGELELINGQTTADTVTTLTVNGSGILLIQGTGTNSATGSTFTVANINNSGNVSTDYYCCGSNSALTVSGTFTNNSGATFEVGSNNEGGDMVNVGTLNNSGYLVIGTGSTLNLTNQPNGITDIAAGSQIVDYGTFTAGSNNALYKLASIEGTLQLYTGKSLTDTVTAPLTVSSTGFLNIQNASSLTVANLTNSGLVATDYYCCTTDSALTVTGTFINNSGATFDVGVNNDGGDVDSVATLTNTGIVNIGVGSTLTLTKSGGTSTNNGTINVGNGNGAGTLSISGNTTLTGTTGKVILSNFAGNIIGGTGTLINVKNTISGSGNIGNGTMGLNNQGTIDADQSVPLIIQASGTVSNSLTMEATNGATLQLDAGTYTQTTAGNILASETGNLTSTVDLESGVVINGGKLTITGTTAAIDLVGASATLTLNGVTISGTGSLQLPDGSTTTLLGANSNTSTIDLNSTGDATTLKIGAAAVSLTGAGKIILASNGLDVITGVSSSDTLTTGNTIEGPGNIGDGVIGVVNTGIIETVAKQTGITTIDAGSAGFNNQGTVEALAATTVYIDNAAGQFLNYNSGTTTLTGGTYIVDGIMKFDGAVITVDAANITLSGSAAKLENSTNSANALTNLNTIANGGSFDIISQTFTTTGNFTNNGTLAVGSGSKFTVDLSDSLTNFSGDTLTGGAYNVTGTLEFAGANIVNNDASITLTGTAAKILNQSAVNALAGFANNESGATFEVTSGNVFTTAGNFTNNGTLIVGSSTSKFIVNLADSLTNFSGGTLAGGTYDLTGILQFAGDIATNDANITLTGTSAKILDASGGNGLANFATNASGASFEVTGGNIFTTGLNFTNNGTLTVGSSTSKFVVNSADTLTNFNSGTNTLTGGIYNVTGVLLFAGANIVNNAANITLTGTTSAIENSTGGNGLASFANNTSTGSFTLAGSRTFTTAGAFTNQGVMDITKASTFTVGANGSYTQSTGSTTVDGTLTVGTAAAVDITGGNLFGATGNINGNVDLTGGTVTPGDGAGLIGELKVTGIYTQGSAGTATIDLGGTTAITQYSVLDITKAATLSGTLNVTLVNGFTPTVGNTFTILDYLSASGTFSTTNLPTVTGDHWVLTYNAKSLTLELESGTGGTDVVDDLTSASSSSAAVGTVSASPARSVSRTSLDGTANSNTHEPVAILSHVTCFASRLVGSESCDKASASTAARGGETAVHAISSASSTISATPHNNVMVATRSISAARGGASHETSASATAMARLYVCAYLPSTVGHTMGCN